MPSSKECQCAHERMRAERMDRRMTGQMIGLGMMIPMLSLDGVNGLVLSMTGHGTMTDGMTGHGMMDGMTVLTRVGKVGMKQNRALLRAVASRMLSKAFSRLSSKVLSKMSRP